MILDHNFNALSVCGPVLLHPPPHSHPCYHFLDWLGLQETFLCLFLFVLVPHIITGSGPENRPNTCTSRRAQMCVLVLVVLVAPRPSNQSSYLFALCFCICAYCVYQCENVLLLFLSLYVQMWMNARPYLASVKEETASTQWDLLNVNAPLGTSSTKSHRSVKVGIELAAIILRLSVLAWMTEWTKNLL